MINIYKQFHDIVDNALLHSISQEGEVVIVLYPFRSVRLVKYFSQSQYLPASES